MKKFYFIFFFFYFYTIEYTSYRQLTRIQSKIEKAKFTCTCGWNFILFSSFRHNFSIHAFKLTLCSYHLSRDLYPSYINCNPFREDVVTEIGEGIFPCACRFKGIFFLEVSL